MGALQRLAFLGLCHYGVAAAGADSFRDSLLQLAHDRLEVQYADKSSLDDPKQRDDVTYQLSKDDKACGNDGVPIMYLDFEISDARPIDAFNVLADGLSQSTWDAHCDKVVEVLDERNLQARGFAATFLAKPLSSREAFEWQVVSANFSSKEFWVVFTTAGNDDLKARRALDPDAVEMQNCLGAYRIQPSANGVHVLGTQQVNSHSSPISARTAANMAWGQTIDWAVAFRKAVQQQSQLGWNDTNTSVPAWMLEAESCEKPDSGDHVRKSVLELAETEFRGSPGQEHSSATLPNGAVLEMWRRDGLCGGDGVPRTSLPAWQTEFCIAGTTPLDVFNVLVAKEKEPSWNALVHKVNITGMHAGARGVHEALRLPNTLWHKWKLRELFEWQAAGHDLANDTYVIATVSTEQRIADMFDAANNMMAFQCLSAYHLSKGTGCNGTQVRTAMHFNPNVGVVSGLSKWWPEAGRTLLQDFAGDLSDRAQKFAANRAAGAEVAVDAQALAMLAPARPDRNSSLDVRTVLSAASPKRFLEQFSSLDLLVALDTSLWPFGDFAARAADVHSLFQKLKQNATAEEERAFASGIAKDSLELQVQGEALSQIQGWVSNFLACGGGDEPHMPDINRHKHPKGLPMTTLCVVLGATIAAAVLGLVCCSWCWYRRCKRQRASSARAAAVARTGADALLQAEQGSA
mmetsp:Transcript_68734/g.128242  ORF Transcript_68734/g.128242 Transcript_68734/m.128242 type:complete len:690 (-) Transcript_68734:96-2165(-)